MAPLPPPPVFLLLLLLCSSASLSSFSDAQSESSSLVKGLSWSFYKSSCPKLEPIVRDHLKRVLRKDATQAAGLLRLHFHDCFVQGCDGSVLLDGSTSGPGEKEAIPNLTLRKETFDIINDLRNRIEKACGRVVSCSDIAALAARDSVHLAGGPTYPVPLGRRDGLSFATENVTLANLPAPFANTTALLEGFKKKNLCDIDLVALSGAHTIGISHCLSFSNRLYPTQDPVMDKTYAKRLYATCPAFDTDNTTVLDIRTPNAFDNKYYVDLVNRQGLFTSDQDLYTDKRTKPIVTAFAVNQSLFFEKFAHAMIKMGQLSVLTGKQGEIRTNCSARNSATFLSSVVGEHGDDAAF